MHFLHFIETQWASRLAKQPVTADIKKNGGVGRIVPNPCLLFNISLPYIIGSFI